MLKRLLIIISLGIFFVGCKSKSPIVTSKQEAIKKGNYRTGYAQKSKEEKTEKVKAEKPSKKKAPKKDKALTNTSMNTSESVQNIVKTALDFEGTKYKYGGTTSKGMDCSGLVYTSFLNNEISLPRSSYNMAQYGEKIKDDDYQVGDLIFFITGSGRRINHVGIITEITDDDVLFIHSSTQKGVIISSLNEAYYQKTFVQVNRVL